MSWSQYYGTGLAYKDAYATQGSAFTLTWRVVDAHGSPMANTAVTLLANKGYGQSNATFTIGGLAVVNSAGAGDGLDVPGQTDGEGLVSFEVTDTTQGSGESATTPINAVDSLDAPGASGGYFGQFGLRVGSTAQLNQSMDIVEVHIINNGIAAPQPVNYDANPGALLWSQEFNDNSGTLPKSSVWTPLLGNGFDQLGFYNYGTGEIELNSATAAQTDGNGNLLLTAIKNGGTWTSSRIWTQGKVNFQYGQLEARIWLPAGSFNWPAFWMLGSNYKFPNGGGGDTYWPNSGEIDIAEGLAGNSVLQSTLHGNNPDNSDWNGGGGVTAVAPLLNLSAGFHTFGMLWTPNTISFTLDGYIFVTNTFENRKVTQIKGGGRSIFDSNGVWPFNKPFFLILDNAIPGSAAGLPDGTTGSMKVDWIHYYAYQGFGAVTP